MAKRKLIVEIVGDASSLDKALGRSTRSVQKFSVGVGTILKSAIGFTAVAAGFDAIGSAVRGSIGEFAEQQKVAAQTQAVLKSTGAAAGVTAKQVDRLASSISGISGIDDEAVKAGENLLLTFRNIRNVGNSKIFDQAIRSATDLSVAMGTDIPQAALQIGKALNDPARGFSRLQRIGVTFTAQQEKLIKNFTKTGDTVKAQKVILAELVKEFGGSAKALGNTVPGQLNKIRESFRNIGGDLVGVVAPAFTSVLGSVADFTQKLSQASGFKAKIRVAFEGIQNLGTDLFNQIVAALRRVDFAQAVQTVTDGLLRGITRIGQALNSVNWGLVGKAIGDGLVRGIKAAAAFLNRVDWGIVGQRIVDGITDFLVHVNWKAVAISTIKVIVAAFTAVNKLLNGIGKGIATALLNGIKAGFAAIAPAVEAAALRVVLKIVKALDFKVLGRHVIPGLNSLVKSIEGKLDELAAHAEKTGDRVSAALGKAAGNVNRSAAVTAPPKTNKQVKAAVEANLADPEAIAKETAKRATAAAKAFKDAQAAREKAFQDMIASLQLRVDRAGLTKSVKDDLGPLLELRKGLEKQIKAGVDVQSAQSQLVSVIGQIQDKQDEIRRQALERTQAVQFKALGLTGTGDKTIPGVENLRKQLGQLSDRLGTDAAPKIRSQLSKIAKVLAGGFGTVTEQTRAKIVELFQTIRGELDKGVKKGPLTKTTSLNTQKVLAGLGLDNATLKELQGRLSRFNSAGVALAGAGTGAPTAFGVALPSGQQPITVESTINLDGETIATVVTKHQQKTGRRNSSSTRGPFSGLRPGI